MISILFRKKRMANLIDEDILFNTKEKVQDRIIEILDEKGFKYKSDGRFPVKRQFPSVFMSPTCGFVNEDEIIALSNQIEECLKHFRLKEYEIVMIPYMDTQTISTIIYTNVSNYPCYCCYRVMM